MSYGLLYTSSTYSIFATNSLLFCGGITHPFTFQGLSSFFLRCFLQLHVRCFLRTVILPSYLPANVTTILHILWAVHYSTRSLTWLQHHRQISFHKYGLLVAFPTLPQILPQ